MAARTGITKVFRNAVKKGSRRIKSFITTPAKSSVKPMSPPPNTATDWPESGAGACRDFPGAAAVTLYALKAAAEWPFFLPYGINKPANTLDFDWKLDRK